MVLGSESSLGRGKKLMTSSLQWGRWTTTRLGLVGTFLTNRTQVLVQCGWDEVMNRVE